MIKILVIGNSFSQDATFYLHQIAEADHIDIQVVNLYFGGCNLEQHWNHIVNNAPVYQYEENGKAFQRYVSINSMLELGNWDYIITQQASYDSGLIDSYYPYIENLAKYIREKAPKAEFLLHETWSYEKDSMHDGFAKYEYNQMLMYKQLSNAYHAVTKKLGVKLIPCGDVIQHMRTIAPFIYEEGGLSLCRDGFHMHFVYGRYLLAAVWYKFITNHSILRNSYIPYPALLPDDTSCDIRILDEIKKVVEEMIF